MVRRPLFILTVGVVLVHVAAACVTGGDESPLNPQPLPPSAPPDEGAKEPSQGSDVGGEVDHEATSNGGRDAGDAGDAAPEGGDL